MTTSMSPVHANAPGPDRVREALRLAEMYAATGDLDSAHATLVAELEALHAQAEPPDSAEPARTTDVSRQRAEATLENALGVLARSRGRLDEAARHYDRARSRLEAQEPGDELASLLHNLGGLCHARDQSAKGIGYARDGLALRIRLHGEDHLLVAADRANLAGLLFDGHALDEAADHFRAALTTFTRELGGHHPEIAVCLSGLASIAAERGDRNEAEALYRRAVEIKTGSQGADHPDTLVTVYNLARLLYEDGRVAQARELVDRVITSLTGKVHEDHRVLKRARDLASELASRPDRRAGGPEPVRGTGRTPHVTVTSKNHPKG